MAMLAPPWGGWTETRDSHGGPVGRKGLILPGSGTTGAATGRPFVCANPGPVGRRVRPDTLGRMAPTAAPEFADLRVSAAGPIGRLVLDRPQKLNALSPTLLESLIGAAGWFSSQRDVKVVIVRGEGRAFCAGADLTGIATRAGGSDVIESARAAADVGRRMAEAVSGMRPLTVAAIQGHCVGGGVVLAAACDLRVAASNAVFSIPEVDLGIPLAWGGIPRLVRELGPAVTKELVLTCRPFDAEEARALGFANRVVSESALEGAAEELAARLAEQPAYSLELTKRHVNEVAEEAGSTAGAFRDADALARAVVDQESLERMGRYLAERGQDGP
jgi:enoyl-CoA hydratase/carnithine racemase